MSNLQQLANCIVLKSSSSQPLQKNTSDISDMSNNKMSNNKLLQHIWQTHQDLLLNRSEEITTLPFIKDDAVPLKEATRDQVQQWVKDNLVRDVKMVKGVVNLDKVKEQFATLYEKNLTNIDSEFDEDVKDDCFSDNFKQVIATISGFNETHGGAMYDAMMENVNKKDETCLKKGCNAAEDLFGVHYYYDVQNVITHEYVQEAYNLYRKQQAERREAECKQVENKYLTSLQEIQSMHEKMMKEMQDKMKEMQDEMDTKLATLKQDKDKQLEVLGHSGSAHEYDMMNAPLQTYDPTLFVKRQGVDNNLPNSFVATDQLPGTFITSTQNVSARDVEQHYVRVGTLKEVEETKPCCGIITTPPSDSDIKPFACFMYIDSFTTDVISYTLLGEDHKNMSVNIGKFEYTINPLVYWNHRSKPVASQPMTMQLNHFDNGHMVSYVDHVEYKVLERLFFDNYTMIQPAQDDNQEEDVEDDQNLGKRSRIPPHMEQFKCLCDFDRGKLNEDGSKWCSVKSAESRLKHWNITQTILKKPNKRQNTRERRSVSHLL